MSSQEPQYDHHAFPEQCRLGPNQTKGQPAAPSGLAEATGSAPTYDLFLGNNDYDTTGMPVSDVLFDLEFELNTVQRAALLLHHGISKEAALAAIDGLRELVAQSDLPNARDDRRRAPDSAQPNGA